MSQPPSSAYDRGLELASAGRYEEALACFHGHLLDHPGDGQALNDAGAVLFALGRFEEAVRNFRRAREAPASAASAQVVENLAEALLAADRPAETLELFEELAGAGALSPDLANRTAVKLLEAGRKGPAVRAMLASLDLAPRQAQIPEALQQVRDGRMKIAWLPSDSPPENSAEIAAFLQTRFPVRRALWGPDQDGRIMEAAVGWCDAAWVDGGLPLLTALATGKRACRIVFRMGPEEAAHPLAPRVAWEKVDLLLLSGGPALREALLRSAPGAAKARRILELPPAVDLDRLPLVPRAAGAPGKALAWVLAPREEPALDLVLQCFARLHAEDPGWRLHVAGIFREAETSWPYAQAMIARLGLGQAVAFEGWQGDLAAWLRDKDCLVCGRSAPGRRDDVLAALAVGVKPVVHAFPGSEELVPADCLFGTVEEFCRAARQPAEPADLRRFAAERFSLRRIHRALDAATEELEDAIAAAAPAPAVGGA